MYGRRYAQRRQQPNELTLFDWIKSIEKKQLCYIDADRRPLTEIAYQCAPHSAPRLWIRLSQEQKLHRQIRTGDQVHINFPATPPLPRERRSAGAAPKKAVRQTRVG
jgi:hypothetical protein